MTFDVARALADPGFTPGERHLPALLELLESCDDATAERLTRVIARAGRAALEHASARFGQASAATRIRLLRLIARCGDDPRAQALELAALADEDLRVRRWAARGLGKHGSSGPDVEAGLLAAFAGADLPLQRALVEALGNVGGSAALVFLAKLGSEDIELARRVAQARLKLQRGELRVQTSRVLLDARLPRVARVVARTRTGLARFAAEELAGFGDVRLLSPSALELSHEGTLGELLIARTALDFGLRVVAPAPRASTPEGVADLLAAGSTLELMRAWSEGPLRFRLAHAAGGHRRASTWKTAELVAARGVELTNDPQQAPWEVVVEDDLGEGGLLLVPRAFDDPRFGYRRADVPAASHPTLAAALARAARVRPDDVVWDPFVGSGLELVERALLGPYARLIGTDLDSRALNAARANLAAASVARYELVQADALSHAPAGVTLILTNPPMGRRVARDGSLRELLGAFVGRAARLLAPGGRLVWLSPLPELTTRRARALGLSVEAVSSVDMGGFRAELQILQAAPPIPAGQATPVPPSPQ
ncbi:MAG TPA: methyltransferase [Polyangiaceae bacterium]|nr:methyltransferase [Polyangiaceae bacterium]